MARRQIESRTRIPPEIRRDIFSECRATCAHCGKHINFYEDFTVEHVIPLHKGGTSDKDNLVALCETCNKEKSDDVVDPEVYYPYLPGPKMLRVKLLFRKYCETTDYLGYDNLLPLDNFDMKTWNTVTAHGSEKEFYMPTKVHIAKMRPDAILEYLMMYGAHLTPGDKNLLLYRKEQIQTPYYMVTQNGRQLLMFSAFIQADFNGTTSICKKPIKRNVIHIQVFGDPDVPLAQKSVRNMVNIVKSILDTIQHNLRPQSHNTMVEVIIATPHSDRLMASVFHWILENTNEFQLGRMLDDDDEDGDDEYAIALDGVLFQGNRKDLRAISESYGTQTMEEFYSNGNLERELASSHDRIQERLKDARRIRNYDPGKAPKKKDKKRPKDKKKTPRKRR